VPWNKTDHQYRKDKILGIVVNEYIKTVTPVSSGHIAREYMHDMSSATIRNILAELEREGYLTHPHTSAGRVPTESGYRYFVDHLMNEIQLLEKEKSEIKIEYEAQVNSLESMLERTSQVISDVTQYTSIVSIDGLDRIFCKGVCHIVGYNDFQDLTCLGHLLRALEEKERLLEIINRAIAKKIRIYIGHEIAWSDIQRCSLAISSYHIGQNTSGRIAVLGPTHMDYPRVVSTLEYFSKVMQELNL